MGVDIKVNCGQCKYEAYFTLGIGLQHHPQAVFYGLAGEIGQKEERPMLASLVKSSKIRKEALGLIAAGGLPDGYGHEVYGCPHCKHLYERFYFRIKTEEKVFEPEYKCSKCRRTLIRLDVDLRERRLPWPCPSCGKKKLSACLVNLWD